MVIDWMFNCFQPLFYIQLYIAFKTYSFSRFSSSLIADATIALKSEFLREIALMKKVSGDICPYVVNMVGCCTHQEPIALVLEYASNGDLLHYLRAMRKLVCAKAMLQQVSVVCLHAQWLIHNVLPLQCDEPEQAGSGESENQYVNGPEASACEDTLRDRDLPVADSDCPVIEEVTPANFISFGWQIASGMVKSHAWY